MKILILSDIHANYPALEAVIEKDGDFDLLFFLGDIVDYGPNPLDCISFIMEKANYYVRGNHDNAIGYDTDCNCMGSFRQFSIATRSWHRLLLTEKELNFLKKMPILNQAHVDNNTFFLAHATPQGDIFKYLDSNDIENEINGITSEFILLGHTHVQFIKKIKNAIVINPGSVGLSRDGGEACYAVYKDGQITLKRIKYNVEKTINDLMKSPISFECKEGLRKILLNLHRE